MKNKTKKVKELPAIKGTVMYYPNGNDHVIRPKEKPLPAVIVDSYDHEYVVTKGDKESTVTRKVYDLAVFCKGEQPVVSRVGVPEKKDALDGEKYIEMPATA